MSNHLYLTLDERNIIEQEFMRNTNFRDIALMLDKDPTTIAFLLVHLIYQEK